MLGKLLKELRERAGRSVDRVAVEVGVHRSAAFGWEAGSVRPTPEHLQALLDLYGATPEERLRAWELRAASASASSDQQPGDVGTC